MWHVTYQRHESCCHAFLGAEVVEGSGHPASRFTEFGSRPVHEAQWCKLLYKRARGGFYFVQSLCAARQHTFRVIQCTNQPGGPPNIGGLPHDMIMVLDLCGGTQDAKLVATISKEIHVKPPILDGRSWSSQLARLGGTVLIVDIRVSLPIDHSHHYQPIQVPTFIHDQRWYIILNHHQPSLSTNF